MDAVSLLQKTQRIRYAESATDTLAAGNNDTTIDLATGTTSQWLRKVRIAAPGVTGTLTVRFYDGAPATTPITGTLYLAGQPADGFDLTGLQVATGSLGIRIAGMAADSPATDVYINVAYTY